MNAEPTKEQVVKQAMHHCGVVLTLAEEGKIEWKETEPPDDFPKGTRLYEGKYEGKAGLQYIVHTCEGTVEGTPRREAMIVAIADGMDGAHFVHPPKEIIDKLCRLAATLSSFTTTE